MYDNEFRIIIILFGFLLLIYIFFISKSNRKYKLYKTKNYDIKKPINILSTNLEQKKVNNIEIFTSREIKSENDKKISVTNIKPKQLRLPLDNDGNKDIIVIYSVAKNFYKISDIYDFMDQNSIFLNDYGFFEKHHVDRKIRCIKYSIANLTNPGFLEKEKLRESKIKGLSFFIQFPTKIDSLKIFNEMVNDAKILSKKYKGTLCDSKHDKLNSKTLKTMKELAGSYSNEY